MPRCEGIRCLFELVIGWTLVVAGIVMTPLPLPIGILMLVLGLVLLVRRSHFVRKQVRRLRRRYPVLSERLRRLEPRLNEHVARTLRDTDPARRKGE